MERTRRDVYWKTIENLKFMKNENLNDENPVLKMYDIFFLISMK